MEALLAWLIAIAGVASIVIAQLHWPTDIAAAALLGTAWVAVIVFALRRAEAG